MEYNFDNNNNNNYEFKKFLKKRDRRNKDDNFDRDFICGCGKSYLSYAALYTHAKTKHNGHFPEGTTTLQKKKQGRPKKEELEDIYGNQINKNIIDFKNEFFIYLDKLNNVKSIDFKSNYNLLVEFPKELFQLKEHYWTLFNSLDLIDKQFNDSYGNNYILQIDLLINEILNKNNLNAYIIVGLFIIFISRFISKGFYKELIFFLCIYIKLCNEKGWNKLLEINKISKNVYDIKNNLNFSEENDCDIFSDLSNDFIIHYFKNYYNDEKFKNKEIKLYYLGTEGEKLMNVIYLTKHFCDWLYIYEFSQAKIEIETEENIFDDKKNKENEYHEEIQNEIKDQLDREFYNKTINNEINSQTNSLILKESELKDDSSIKSSSDII